MLTFFRQIELLELGTLLVELNLQLLFALEELGPLLLQILDTLLEKPCHSSRTLFTIGVNRHNNSVLTQILHILFIVSEIDRFHVQPSVKIPSHM